MAASQRVSDPGRCGRRHSAGAAVAAGTIHVPGWPNDVSDRLATLADSVSVATLVLAIAAGVVGLAAHLVAIRRPDLNMTITFGGNQADSPNLLLDRSRPAPKHFVALVEGLQLRAASRA